MSLNSLVMVVWIFESVWRDRKGWLGKDKEHVERRGETHLEINGGCRGSGIGCQSPRSDLEAPRDDLPVASSSTICGKVEQKSCVSLSEEKVDQRVVRLTTLESLTRARAKETSPLSTKIERRERVISFLSSYLPSHRRMKQLTSYTQV